MHRFGLLATLVLVSFTLAFPQASSRRSTITGTVQDQTGAAIVEARVELKTANAGQQSTTTDQSGSFRFNEVLPGNYQVVVSYQGFESSTSEVTLGPQPLGPAKATTFFPAQILRTGDVQ